MKNELDHFRKYSLVEYSINLKKFKEYLEYCKKNNLSDEKTYIMENLVNQTNEKSLSGISNLSEILNEFTNLCVHVVIFSDFEIENFFKIQNFSPNFQKTVLFQAINYCLDRSTKEMHEIVYIKYQYWVLKLMNRNISITGETKPALPISPEELNQSIESLTKKLNGIVNNTIDKSLLLKVSFELGYYFYMTDNLEKMKNYFFYCIEIMEKEDKNYLNTLYFNKEELKQLINLCESNPFLINENYNNTSNNVNFSNVLTDNNVEMIDLTNDQENSSLGFLNLSKESNIVETDFENFLNKISIDSQAKLIIDKYSIDDVKTLELFNINELVKYSKNLIFLSSKNFSKLNDTKIYINKVQEIISSKSINVNSNINVPVSDVEKKDLILCKKENSYHLILISIIESIYMGEEKLRKKFLTELSQSIIKLTLTDDIQISGMIHGLIINFSRSFKSVINYFNDFVEFFKQTTNNSEETVNQIIFISAVCKIINFVLYSDHIDNNVIIDGSLHTTIFNLCFYWMKSLKDKKTNKNDNIIFVLIKMIKNSNFLIILKIIYLAVIKFVGDKKNISTSYNDELFEQINSINSNCFNIELLINENKNNEKLRNLNIQFRENQQTPYNFDALDLNFFEVTMFNLVKKIENKIIYNLKYSEIEYLERRNNLLFFEYKSLGHLKSSSPNNSTLSISTSNNFYDNSKIVSEFIKFYKTKFKEFEINFHQLDYFENIDQITNYYMEFKINLDEIILLRFIYILANLGKNIEASILLQYTNKIDYDLAYKLLKKNIEFHNVDLLEYIWKITYFELLGNIYYQNNRQEHLSVVSNLIRRTSNHQFFRRHPLRKLFKIINFFKFIENIKV